MECTVCMEWFEPDRRRPKCLPCGHTYCLVCLQNPSFGSTCPQDRKQFQGLPADLPDNFSLLSIVRDFSATSPVVAVRSLWCGRCEAVAETSCLAEHPLSGLRAARARQAQPRLDTLLAREAALEEMELALEPGSLEAELAGCRGGVARLRAELAAARSRLTDELQADDVEWRDALRAAESCAVDAGLLAADLSGGWESFILGLRPEGQPRAAWVGTVVSSDSSALRLLLCRLVCEGRLWRQEHDREVDEEGGEKDQERGVQDQGPEDQDHEPEEQDQEPGGQDQEPGDRDQGPGDQDQEREGQQDEGQEGGDRDLVRGDQEDVENVSEGDEDDGEGEDSDSAASAAGWDEKSNSGWWTSRVLRVGSRVIRSNRWPSTWKEDMPPSRWGNAMRSEGVVTGTDGNKASVKWDWSGEEFEGYPHHTLRPLVTPAKELLVCNAGDRSGSHAYDASGDSDIHHLINLLASGRLKQVRTLVGLSCFSGDIKVNAVRLILHEVSDHVRVLGLSGADAELLKAAVAMPHLRSLHLTSPVDRETLVLAAGMPRLRRLEVYSDRRQLAALAGLRFPRGAAPAGLRWLRVGVYPLATALSLARAHAHTLEELHLVAASAEPYGCPDLAAELGRCGLGKLRRLVLVRRTGDYLCGHDAAECRRQKRQLATLPTAPRVECSACDNVDPPAF